MKSRNLLFINLLLAGLIVLAACSKTPAATPVAETVAETETLATASEPTPEPTVQPTEIPVFPCNIVFDSDRDGNLEIYSMDPEGNNQVNLTNNPADDFNPVWSPDGSHIAFISNRETEEGNGVHIYMMASDGSEVTQITHGDDAQFPDWSPAGDKIAYNNGADIYIINLSDGSEINLTNSPEHDSQPKFSPDGQSIAWLIGEEPDSQIAVMDLDSGSVAIITNGGTVFGIEWTIDGRLFTTWNHPEGMCMNCIVSADGSEVIDAGGKGSIQQYLPFWTLDGNSVEMISGDIRGTGREDITLIGEIFPDIFYYLTNDAGNNRNPDTAAHCGPFRGENPAASAQNEVSHETISEETSNSDSKYVIGYTGSIDPITQYDIDIACSELELECIHEDQISDLVDKRVDAIINASNRWDVYGSMSQVHDAVSAGIPVFMLNAVNSEKGVYNLSAEEEANSIVLSWMFESMATGGDFVYYNYANSDYIQNLVDGLLKDYPNITSTELETNYGENPFSSEIPNMIAANPNLGAIWSSDPSNDLFWAVVDKNNSHFPLMECPAREDILTAWKNELDAGSDLQCRSLIRPGGIGYEGVYVAYYFLSGYELNPEMLTGEGQNTLRYVLPLITNENLPEWLGKLDSFIVGGDSQLKLPHMDPQQILETWFIQ